MIVVISSYIGILLNLDLQESPATRPPAHFQCRGTPQASTNTKVNVFDQIGQMHVRQLLEPAEGGTASEEEEEQVLAKVEVPPTLGGSTRCQPPR